MRNLLLAKEMMEEEPPLTAAQCLEVWDAALVDVQNLSVPAELEEKSQETLRRALASLRTGIPTWNRDRGSILGVVCSKVSQFETAISVFP